MNAGTNRRDITALTATRPANATTPMNATVKSGPGSTRTVTLSGFCAAWNVMIITASDSSPMMAISSRHHGGPRLRRHMQASSAGMDSHHTAGLPMSVIDETVGLSGAVELTWSR